LRVLFVTNMWPEHGGFRGTFVEQQASSLRELGHHVDVEIVAQARGIADYVLAAPRVRRRAREGRYDVVHVHFGLTAFAARLVDRPRVITLYGSDINERLKRWWTRLSWGGAAARVYVSRSLAAVAGDRAGRVVPNGVDFDLFRPGERTAARTELGVGPDDRLILFGSQPERAVKGHDVFADVVRRLRSQGIPARELILTSPGQAASRVVAKYDAADVLLFTSRRGSEGSPTVVKEAIAMGLPVVSVDVGDVAEMLAGIEPSEVVAFPKEGNAGAARDMLVGRLADATARVLANGARADGRERLSWLSLDQVAGRVVDVYRSVAT
jgi:glycosyltransferase involved in cell wall biosynthesis